MTPNQENTQTPVLLNKDLFKQVTYFTNEYTFLEVYNSLNQYYTALKKQIKLDFVNNDEQDLKECLQLNSKMFSYVKQLVKNSYNQSIYSKPNFVKVITTPNNYGDISDFLQDAPIVLTNPKTVEVIYAIYDLFCGLKDFTNLKVA